MNKDTHKAQKRDRRALRTRRSLVTSSDRPRLSVHRSLKHISGQIIDHTGKTLLMVTDRHVGDSKLRGVKLAEAVGALLAQRAVEMKISRVAFDKGPYTYHGRVKALAEGARSGGLEF